MTLTEKQIKEKGKSQKKLRDIMGKNKNKKTEKIRGSLDCKS